MPNLQIYKIMYKYLKHFLSKLGVKNLYLRWAKVFQNLGHSGSNINVIFMLDLKTPVI